LCRTFVLMDEQSIQSRILALRGCKVMLDFDLAVLYGVETRILNQSIKRNLENFPEDFMFRMTQEEWERQENLWKTNNDIQSFRNSSQFVMSSRKHRGKSYTPYAFTEHGVAMLASVLKSPQARKMNIAIVRAFIELRKLPGQVGEMRLQLSELRNRIGEHDVQLAQIYDSIENLLDHKSKQERWEDREVIGFRKAEDQ
jgi:hypothetical protein